MSAVKQPHTPVGKGRGRQRAGLSPVGDMLSPYLDRTYRTYASLAQAMRLGSGGEQALRRLFRGQGRTFRTISLDALIHTLGVSDADATQLLQLVSQRKLSFASAPPPTPLTPYVTLAPLAPSAASAPAPDPAYSAAPAQTHAWQPVEQYQEREEDLIRLLHLGDADYVGRRAQALYLNLAQPGQLPEMMQKEWLLRFGRMVEQAQEAAGVWHGDRVGKSLAAIKQLQLDISRLSDSHDPWIGFQFDAAILEARKAVLFRERHGEGRDGRRYLWMSNRLLEDAKQSLIQSLAYAPRLSEYDRVYRLPMLELALTCQRLHNDAVEGDLAWEQRIDVVARTVARDQVALGRLREAVMLYYQAMGHKRLAWVYREQAGDTGVATRHALLANQRLDEFTASPFRSMAWQASNFFPFQAPNGARVASEQVSLVSQQQADLLFTVNSLEAQVWLQPNRVKEEIARLRDPAVMLYRSLTTKLNITTAFAQHIIEL